MNIGKQSTLNDLGDLKVHLEAKIAEASAIKVGEVSQIESGLIGGGSVFDFRGTGVFGAGADVAEASTFGIDGSTYKNGMILEMQLPNTGSQYKSGLFINWACDAYLLANAAGVKRAIVLRTSKNTIIDSNGFIKAA